MVIVLDQPQYEWDTVESLVLAAQAGNRDAFGELIQRFESSVYAIVYRRLRNDAEAQETCQDVFLQAMRKIDQLRNPECFGGWLRSTASRMAINRAMRRKPMVFTEPEILEETCSEHNTPYSLAVESERRSQVHAGLDQLRALDRETLHAFYIQGQSLIEMSKDFQSPIGTIKRRLHVARKRLARELELLAEV